MFFPFIEFLGLENEQIFRPMIPISFTNGRKHYEKYCLIDSGSDYVILPFSAAEKLGFNIYSLQSYQVCTANGKYFSIFKSPSKVDIEVRKTGSPKIRLKSFIYFSESENEVLLGQNNLLNQINLRLDGLKKEVEIL